MCLTKTHRLPKISRKPIQVYKVFEHNFDRLVTPYKRQLCKVGETIKAKHSWLKGIFKDEIWGEGVHAYVYKDTAEDETYLFSSDVVVHLCEIPPFTPYWIGENDEIAASKMIIKERVK